MANNTVTPTSEEDKNRKLASNPATRRKMADLSARQAAREWRSDELSSVKPIPKKKSFWQKTKDYVLDLGHDVADAGRELFYTDTPEKKEMRQKYSEELNETLQKKVDKQAKDLAITTAVAVPIIAGGAGAKGVTNLVKAGATGVGTGIIANLFMDDKKKAKAETVPTTNTDNTNVNGNNGGTTNGGTTNNNNTTNNTEDTEDAEDTENTEDKTYDNYVTKVAKQQGLGKYVKEDGTIDYDKLQKSKVGYQILNALLAGIAGAAAGAAFKDAPDMSKSMLAQEVAKRNKVVDEAQKTAEQEKQNALDLSTFTAKLGLQGRQALNAQKEIARFMSNLSYNDQVRMMDYMQGMSIQDAAKLGFAQNPYGAMSMIFNSINNIKNAFSDECCKEFASRKVFK